MAGELTIDSGDTAWMLVSTALVMMMLLPGLALFYGGLVRAKNLLSVMSQVLGIAAIAILVWVGWGYSAWPSRGGSSFVGGLSKVGLAGLDGASAWAVPTPGKAIPELRLRRLPDELRRDHRRAGHRRAGRARALFGDHAVRPAVADDRLRAARAHGLGGRRAVCSSSARSISPAGRWCTSIPASPGWSASLSPGRAIGHLKEAMPPHSLALTMVGAGLLWVGWFGFNAGSALEANGLAAVAMVNTFVAPAAGVLGWMGVERVVSGKPSMLGGASGAVAGLVAVTPAAGVSGPIGAMLLGAAGERRLLRLRRLAQEPAAARRQPRRVRDPRPRRDRRLDRHRVRRAAGARRPWRRRLCARLAAAAAARCGRGGDRLVGGRVGAVLRGRSAGLPLRHDRDGEREGLDISDHGERAYNY